MDKDLAHHCMNEGPSKAILKVFSILKAILVF